MGGLGTSADCLFRSDVLQADRQFWLDLDRGIQFSCPIECRLRPFGIALEVVHDGKEKLLEVDNVIVCAGQKPRRDLQKPLEAAGKPVHLIGGADVAAELDAKRAIKQGTELAATI